MKDLEIELAAERSAANVALAEAEKRHTALGQRKQELANKKIRLLDLVRRVASADALRVHRETVAAAAVAAEAHAAAERSVAASLAAAARDVADTAAAHAAHAAHAATHGTTGAHANVGTAETGGGALRVLLPKLSHGQTGLYSESTTAPSVGTMLYSPHSYPSAPPPSLPSTPALPRLPSAMGVSREGHSVAATNATQWTSI